MRIDNRRWTAQGDRLIGTCDDGRPDQVLLILPSPLGARKPAHVLLVAEVTAGFNGVTPSDRRVLKAALTQQLETGCPATVAHIAAATDLTKMWVHKALDRLVAADCGTRPPKGERPRPFVAHTWPAATDGEGEPL